MKRFIAVLLALLTVFSSLVFSAGVSAAGTSYISFKIMEVSDNVSLHSDLQNQYLRGPLQNATDYASGIGEYSRPAAVTLSWKTSTNNEKLLDADYLVHVAKNPDFTNERIYVTRGISYGVTNLELDTVYYWKVSVENEEKVFESPVSSFRTERNGPRNISVGGVTNFRDIGGYTTLTGDVVKQGNIYRCGQLNHKDGSVWVTEKGITEMKKVLGIKSEIDLRRSYDGENVRMNKSVLGSGVNYFATPMDYSGNLLEGTFREDNLGSLRAVFKILSDEKNYPVIFHCAIGTDRTGMVAYLLEALLGMSETDIMRDYVYSNFGNISGPRYVSTINTMYPKVIKSYPGKTLSEKTYRYLNEVVKIPKDQLDAVIRINLQKVDSEPDGIAINTEEDFYNMSPVGSYYLEQDVAVSESYAETFYGKFDGNGHVVLVEKPLFSNLCGIVKNLTVDGCVESAEGDAAALAADGTNFICINVKNLADVISDGKYSAAGLVAHSNAGASFIGCENNGNITSLGYAAGILCKADGEVTLSSCTNNGSVTANCEDVSCCAGGLVAEAGGCVMVQNSLNAGAVSSESSGAVKYLGGICGYLSGAGVTKTFFSAQNSGIVESSADSGEKSYLGGVVGYGKGKSYSIFDNCKNEGELISNGNGEAVSGGIFGSISSCDEWSKDAKGWFYVDAEGNKLLNQSIKDTKGSCLLGANGYWITSEGWKKAGSNWYYVQPSGYLSTNTVVKDANGYCLVDASGRWVTAEGWKTTGTYWYCVGQNGYLRTSCWMKDSKGWCYLGSQGRMLTSAKLIDSKGMCLVDSSGYWITAQGWYLTSGAWCYVDKGGYLKSNSWAKDTKGWCYLDSNGYVTRNKWVKDSKGWCYCGADGYIVYNKWLKDSVGWRYVGSDGYQVFDTYAYDSTGRHYIGKDGYMK